MELSLEEALKRLIRDVMEDSDYGPKMRCVMQLFSLDIEEVTTAVLDYTIRMDELTNDFYSCMASRAALYLHSLVRTSYHQKRQDVIIKYLSELPMRATNAVEIGFGVPGKYVTKYIEDHIGSRLTLVDYDHEAINFGQAVLKCTNPNMLKHVDFRTHDMDEMEYIGDFDAYLFLDSIEHTKNPTGYLQLTVRHAPEDARFIFSLPICQNPTPMHFIEFLNLEVARAWLLNCGLCVESEELVKPIPTTDFFAALIKGGFMNYMVLCRKVNAQINSNDFSLSEGH